MISAEHGGNMCMQLACVLRPSAFRWLTCVIKLFGHKRRRLNIQIIYSVTVGFYNYNLARILSNCMSSEMDIVSMIFVPVQLMIYASNLSIHIAGFSRIFLIEFP